MNLSADLLLRRAAVALAFACTLGAPAQAQSSGGESMTFPDPFVPKAPNVPPVRPPKRVYFPALPPPLYHVIKRDADAVRDPGDSSRIRLADCVNEAFYPQLASRVGRDALTAKERRELQDYFATKRELQEQLRAGLEVVTSLDPGARPAALAALAKTQGPRLTILEHSAEKFREQLAIDEYAWGAKREWRLGRGSLRGDSPDEVAGVMRAAAYFQSGLSREQRDVLRLIAAEILSPATEESELDVAAEEPYLQFFPAPARIPLPENLPSPLAARIADFETRLSALKKELYDAIYEQDGARIGFIRRVALSSLAGRQAPAFAALEELAEEIRRDLALQPAAPRNRGTSPLPPVLSARVAELIRQRQELRGLASARIARLREGMFVASIIARFGPGGLHCTIRPLVRGPVSSETERQLNALESELGAVVDDYNRSHATLAKEMIALRSDVAQLPGFESAAAINMGLAKAAQLAVYRQDDDAYENYRAAVLAPGLSPAQRRLLFDAAITQLDLPRPPAELQPVARYSGW